MGSTGCGEAPASALDMRTSLEVAIPLNCSEGWDPLWSQGSGANNWWVEIQIDSDDTVTSAHLEVLGLGVVELSLEYGKWVGSPAFSVGTGADVIVHATSSFGQSAQTYVFPYLLETLPTTDCVGTCTPSCGGRECGSDGCGGSCGSCSSGETCGAGQCSEAPELIGGLLPDFQETVVASGLAAPTTGAFSPDGRLFVAERSGALRVIKNGQLLATPFLRVPVSTDGERGLVGVAVDPNFSSNRHIYIYYTITGGDPGVTRISRFTASATNPDVAQAGSELVLLDDIPNAFWHNSGAMHFGVDGMLYFAVGDNNVRPSAQSLEAITGKIGRIDPSSYPNLIPDDNPFVGTPGAREEIWARGFRNPFTFAVDPVAGTIFVNDVGDADWEEINELEKGASYGWPSCEGNFIQESDQPCTDAAFNNPIYAYPHDATGGLNGCSIIGGAFYRGSQFPAEYEGSYFFVDYCERWIARMAPDRQVHLFATDRISLITTLLMGPDGSLYYINNGNGNVYKLEYVGSGNRAPIANASASPTEGASPLEVRFSASGSSDPDGDALSYSWSFGDGSFGTGFSPVHTYTGSGFFDAGLTVSDGNGGSASDTVRIQVGDTPTAAIHLPVASARYNAGDTIQYSGSAVDSAGSPLPASAFSWTITFHHDDHTHPFLGPINGVRDGSFLIATTGELSENVSYRISLTVSDAGLTHEVTRDVRPNTATIRLATSPPGLQLNLDEGTVSTPHSVVGVTGMERELAAPSPQLIGGQWYAFDSWSNGEARSHTISTPSVDTTYTATFTEVSDPGTGADEVLYDDNLHWSDWSWRTTVNASASFPVLTGTSSMAVTYTSGWDGLSLYKEGFDTSPYQHLRFGIHSGGRPLPAMSAWFHLPGGASTPKVAIGPYASPAGGGWYVVEIPLEELGATNTSINRLNLQDNSGSPQPTFHIDDVRIAGGSSSPPPPPPPPSDGPLALVYDDELQWNDWSWGADVDPGSTSRVYAGTSAIALTYTQAWGGLSLQHTGFDTSPYSHLVMALHPGSGTLPRLTASLYNTSGGLIQQVEIGPWSTPAENGWRLVAIPLSTLGGESTTITRVQLQDGTGTPSATIYLDELGFADR